MYSHLSCLGNWAETFVIMTHSGCSFPPHILKTTTFFSFSFGGHFMGMFSHVTASWAVQLWSMLKWPFCYNGTSDLECFVLFFFNVWFKNKQAQISSLFWIRMQWWKSHLLQASCDCLVPTWRSVGRLWQVLGCCPSSWAWWLQFYLQVWPHNSCSCRTEWQSALAEVEEFLRSQPTFA